MRVVDCMNCGEFAQCGTHYYQLGGVVSVFDSKLLHKLLVISNRSPEVRVAVGSLVLV